MRTMTWIACGAASALFLLGACGGNEVAGGNADGLGTVELACTAQGVVGLGTVRPACEEDGGCTLTQGYWKTHSKYGPAPYDDAWEVFEEGPLDDPEDGIYQRAIPCYDVLGLTWYEQFWASPRGNAWLQLSHQYAAAWLNYYNGADIDTIHDELDVEARALLNGFCPGDPGFDAKRADFVRLAARLEAFNSGLIGPGHCRDE
jgi:hypothetical protein